MKKYFQVLVQLLTVINRPSFKFVSNKSMSTFQFNSKKWDQFVNEDKSFSELSCPKELIEDLASKAESLADITDKVLKSNANIFLIGEGSHGTHEFYNFRAELTKSLIQEGKCLAVLLESDLPDTANLHRYVMGSMESNLDDLFVDFERFPSWMWANQDMKEFVSWLKDYNSNLPIEKR